MAWLALLLLVVFPVRSHADGTAMRIEVPIYQRKLSNGELRYWVPVRVGGSSQVEAMLDTGSFGLRVMASALSPADYQATDLQRDYHFGGGVALHGVLAKAVIAIGGATTGAPIFFQLVQSVGCGPMKPDCPAARLPPEQYGIGGSGLPNEGFKAILGLSMRVPEAAAAAVSPLSFIGERAWIVMLPLPGEDKPGALVINPNPAERRGFRSIALDQAGAGASKRRLAGIEVPACLGDAAADPASCSPMKLDTGSRDGLPPFYRFVVLYDLKSRSVGVKKRAPSSP